MMKIEGKMDSSQKRKPFRMSTGESIKIVHRFDRRSLVVLILKFQKCPDDVLFPK